MISLEQLDAEIKILEDKEPNYTIMSQLASLYTVRDHMHTEDVKNVDTVDIGSRFYELIKNKKIESVYMALDELMDTLSVLNPNLYDSIVRKFNEL